MGFGDEHTETTKWCHEALSVLMKQCKEYKNLAMPKREYPKTDTIRLEDKYEYVMEVPEFSYRDSINVRVENKDELVVSGRMKDPSGGGRYLKKDDRKIREFDRRFQLADDANTNNINAKYSCGGILTVTVPRRVVPVKPKVVAVLPKR